MDLNELQKEYNSFGYYITKVSDMLYCITEYGMIPPIFCEFYTIEMLEDKLLEMQIKDDQFNYKFFGDQKKEIDKIKEEYKDILEDEEDGK